MMAQFLPVFGLALLVSFASSAPAFFQDEDFFDDNIDDEDMDGRQAGIRGGLLPGQQGLGEPQFGGNGPDSINQLNGTFSGPQQQEQLRNQRLQEIAFLRRQNLGFGGMGSGMGGYGGLGASYGGYGGGMGGYGGRIGGFGGMGGYGALGSGLSGIAGIGSHVGNGLRQLGVFDEDGQRVIVPAGSTKSIDQRDEDIDDEDAERHWIKVLQQAEEHQAGNPTGRRWCLLLCGGDEVPVRVDQLAIHADGSLAIRDKTGRTIDVIQLQPTNVVQNLVKVLKRAEKEQTENPTGRAWCFLLCGGDEEPVRLDQLAIRPDGSLKIRDKTGQTVAVIQPQRTDLQKGQGEIHDEDVEDGDDGNENWAPMRHQVVIGMRGQHPERTVSRISRRGWRNILAYLRRNEAVRELESGRIRFRPERWNM